MGKTPETTTALVDRAREMRRLVGFERQYSCRHCGAESRSWERIRSCPGCGEAHTVAVIRRAIVAAS